MEHLIASQKMTLSKFLKKSKSLLFQFFIFELSSLKIFLMCSYFVTNSCLTVLIKFVLTEKNVRFKMLRFESF